MLTITLLVATSFQQIVDIGKIEHDGMMERATVSADGNLYYIPRHAIHGWNQDLEKIVEIKVPDYVIQGFYVDKEYIIVSRVNSNNQKHQIVLLDFQGNEIADFPLFGTQFRSIEGQLYTFLINTDFNPPYHGKYPYQFQPIKIQPSANDYYLHREGLPLFKATPLTVAFHLNYKDSWGVYKNGHYYFVNELEPRVFIASPADALAEHKKGASKQSELPSLPLELEGFNPMTEQKLRHYLDNYPFNSAKDDMFNVWEFRHSTISKFQLYDDGFLVAYEYLQCEDVSDCRDPLLGLQKFDDQFRALQEPKALPGMLLGTIGLRAYILQFQTERTRNWKPGYSQARIVVLDSL